MPTDQYHEPPAELPEETRTFARISAGLIEEAEAINWYEQRIAIEPDEGAKKIMREAQEEEMKHFAMNLEFLLRRKETWRAVAQKILFSDGDIAEIAEQAEEEEIH